MTARQCPACALRVGLAHNQTVADFLGRLAAHLAGPNPVSAQHAAELIAFAADGLTVTVRAACMTADVLTASTGLVTRSAGGVVHRCAECGAIGIGQAAAEWLASVTGAGEDGRSTDD